jgi:hypothetical protein
MAFADIPGAPVYCSPWVAVAGHVPDGWVDLHTVAPDRLQCVTSSSSDAPWRILRVEVRPGDKVNGWSGERAEVSGMCDAAGHALPVDASTGHEFYALSVKVAADWRTPDKNHAGYRWGTCFQLHGPDRVGASPSLALMVEDDFHLDLCSGDVMDHGTRNHPQGSTVCAFSDGDLNRGHWTQFLLDVTWAADASGRVIVSRRNAGETAWRSVCTKEHVPTLQYRFGEPVGPHYWKAGLYRSESPHTNLLWLGPIARGRDREAVLRAAFGPP